MKSPVPPQGVCGFSFYIILAAMTERVSIYIDGGNFYHLVLKKLAVAVVDFDFDRFADFIANGRQIVSMGKRYYIGTVRQKEGDSRAEDAVAQQNKIFSSLKLSQWEIKTSKLRERQERLVIDNRVENCTELKKKGIKEIKYTRNREKGIDVKIVTDLFIAAMDNRYDTAIVVSSDTDLVPAIDVIRHRFKKRVEYIGFSILDPENPKNNTTPTLSLITRTDIQRTLIESELRNFVKAVLPFPPQQ